MVEVGQWQDDTQTCADLRTISSYPSPDTDLNTNAQAYTYTDTHNHADRYPLTYPDATGRSWGTGRRFDSSGSGDCD